MSVYLGRIGIHSWSVLAGLSELAAQSWINLRYRSGSSIASGQGILVRVGNTDVLFDLADQQELLVPDFGGTTFKRSFSGRYTGDVRPLGLVAGYRSGSESLFRLAAMSAMGTRRAGDVVRCLWLAVGHGLPPAYRSFALPEVPKMGTVLFQVRAWSPDLGSNSQDRREVNASRAELIVALRKQFGERFVGGFVDSPFARVEYRDLIAPSPPDTWTYSSLVRRCAIGISSSGLHGSNPWKLFEYLAAGCAIVSEPLQSSLPAELDASGAAQFFSSATECVEKVAELLASNAWREMGAAAKSYFESEVRPDRLLWNRLMEL